MIIDGYSTFSNGQAVTASANSTDLVDLGSLTDFGAGDPQLMLVVRAGTAATAAGAATVNFVLQGSTDAAFTTPITVFDSGAIAKTALTANKTVVRTPLASVGQLYRYLRVAYTVGTGPLTAGTFDAFLTPVSQNNRSYADAVTTS